VRAPAKRLQPSSYHAFRCIGADCEDTCCVGWVINVDKATYEAYQRCEDRELGLRLRQLVTINANGASDDNYSRITISRSGCPFLSDGLCAIQKKLGEKYLSIMCSTYPRVMNVVDDVLQRSLDLSCPEAARLVLSDPDPMEFDQDEGELHDPRLGRLSTLTTSQENSGKPYRYFREIRELVIWLLQYRTYPLSKRLEIVGSLCDRLHELSGPGAISEIPEILKAYRDGVSRDPFHQELDNYCAQPALQLEMALELILGRIGSDYTVPRFLACYREFMEGIAWTAESNMDDIAQRYASAFSQHYTPFMSVHQYMLEHYLVSYVHRTLFPLGAPVSDQEALPYPMASSIRDRCLMIMVNYAIIQTILIGVAGLHRAEFAAGHVLKVIQSFSKTFEHSLSFPGRALQILAGKGVKTCADLAVLVRNPG
jgi:lysine-N-methylase